MKHLGTKTIETKRLILRKFTLNDAEVMYQNWASEPEVTKYLTWQPHESVEVTKAVIKGWMEDYREPEHYVWCIELKEIGEAIGSIGAGVSNAKVGAMEIGYCISEAYWHQGITSEALAAVMDFLIKEVGVRRIEAKHDTRNLYSGKVMEKCGLKYEGTKIQAECYNSGICDVAFYGLVMEDAVVEEEDEEKVYVAPVIEKKAGEKNVISDETIEYVGILAKLELSDEEKENAKKDMGEMLDYIDKLNELDTTGVEPMSHVFPVHNVFREDVVTNGDGSKETLANAPEMKDGGFKVPKTIG